MSASAPVPRGSDFPALLRKPRRSGGLPLLAAVTALFAAAANLAAALGPDAPARAHLLLRAEPVVVPAAAHPAAMPVAGVLAIVGLYLFKRRRRAAQAALLLLGAACCLDVLAGRELEGAAFTLVAALLLWWGRDSFCVRHDPVRGLAGVRRLPAVWLAALGGGAVAVWASTGWDAGLPAVVRETGALLLWSSGPVTLTGDYRGLTFGIGALGLLALVGAAAAIFRPLAVPQRDGDEPAPEAAFRLVRAHGHDTLAFFKLRMDNRRFFACDGSAFLAYKISGPILLVSGDPVGPVEALPGLLAELREFARARGLVLGAVGAGAELLGVQRDAGLRALYIGDEAIVETRAFSLEGRAIRKVRQSVNRLVAAGFTTRACRLDELDPATLAELERISRSWRGRAPERGFAMTMPGLACPHPADTTVVVARDAGGVARAFLHLVPTYGRPAVSLSLMRRERDTPNGLMEFLIVRTVEELRARGVEEISLNFAAFARWMHAPRNRLESLLGRVVSLANPFFQIESLYRFNAKFRPRWSPRYLLYERPFDLPRVALATMRVEGLTTLRSQPPETG